MEKKYEILKDNFMKHLSEIKSYRDYLKEEVEELDDDKILILYNKYNDNAYNQTYYNSDDFLNESFSTPTEAMQAVCYGEYNYADTYVRINYYGELESTSDLSNFIGLSELIDVLEKGKYLFDEYDDYYLSYKRRGLYNDLEGFEKSPKIERLKILKNIKIIEEENQDEEKNDFFDSIRNEVENLLEDDFPKIYDLDVEQIDLIIEKLNLKQNKDHEIEL